MYGYVHIVEDVAHMQRAPEYIAFAVRRLFGDEMLGNFQRNPETEEYKQTTAVDAVAYTSSVYRCGCLDLKLFGVEYLSAKKWFS